MTIVAADKLTETLEKSDVPVLAYFSATWCGPCRTFRPRIEAMAEEADHFVLVNIDVDDNPELASEYNISSVPTVIGFADGENKDRFSGVKSDSMVQEFIEGLVE